MRKWTGNWNTSSENVRERNSSERELKYFEEQWAREERERMDEAAGEKA